MRIGINFDSLRETTPLEYAMRFAIGGAVTVVVTLIADRWGPVIGGLMLAYPSIFVPGLTLVEKHKIEREQMQGEHGTLAARGEASVEAAGASLGALGLAAFALVLWKELEPYGMAESLAFATGAWAVVSYAAWWVREKM